MRIPGSVRLVIASIGVHAAVFAAALWRAEAPPAKDDPVSFEIVRRSAAAEPPPPPPRVLPAVVEPVAPVAAPRVARARLPLEAAPTPPPAGAATFPGQDAADDDPSPPPRGAGLGRGYDPLGATAAGPPPAPPPPPPASPPPPRPDVFVDTGWEDIYVLLRSWQHQADVRRCMERALGAGDRLAMAVRTGDRLTAVAEVKKLRDAPSSAVLYGRARKCLGGYR